MVNAPTRTIQITVKDNRKMFVGKLYYIEAIDMVAYLVQDTIVHSYTALSTRNLSFCMLRQVIRRPIAEILKVDDEILNVGMMFTTDFPNKEGLDSILADGFEFQAPGVKSGPILPSPKNLMFTKGKQFLENLQKNSVLGPFQPDQLPEGTQRAAKGSDNGMQSKSDVRLVMFKYIPCIEDLIMEIESTPRLVEPPVETSNNVEAAKQTAKNSRLKNFVDGAGFLYYTAGFKNGIEQNVDDRLRYLRPIIDISSKPITEKRIDLNTPSLTDPLNINYSTVDPKAPMAMAGLIGYVFPTVPEPGSIEVKSDFIEVPGGAPISYFKSPFLAQALSNPPKNIALSELLMNKLVDFDLDMKYVTSLSAITVNQFGIQQYYYLSGDRFVLFGSSRRPSDYLQNLPIPGERSNTEVSQFQDQILNSVGCLKLNKDMTAFENDFFTIPVRNGGFDLPFGHLVLKVGAKPGDMTFYRTYGSTGVRDGGSFRVTPGPLKDEFLITPLDSQSKIEDENNPGSITDLGGVLQLSSPNGLYFMSPFLEPTIERLLDIHMPPELGGNLSSSDADKQKRLSSKGVLSSQAKRQSGQAVNVSIDVLLIASKSNSQVVGGPRPAATPLASPAAPPIYRRFEQFGVPIFQGGAMLPISNALKGNLVLPSGISLGEKNLMIYTLAIEDFQENSYASRLQSNGVAATVGA
jgi:hypothetical protein